MDVGYLSAFAALAGSAVGGLTTFLATWLNQNKALKAQLLLHDNTRKQELYQSFIGEASKLYIEALTNNTPDHSKIVALYALISQMRIISSQNVISEGEKAARLIMKVYDDPNKTHDELREMRNNFTADPLQTFSDCCRKELKALTIE